MVSPFSYTYNALVQTELLILFLCDFKEATFREVASFLLPEKKIRAKKFIVNSTW